ncbi:hypothetical protein FQV39_11780 [Bosea sp. F3-2]|jgi:hypothetical protein|uniref:hypothetical protein n=1 Tax=Bosea sp. F3-2 TaxID=2599640 RepID=UPI0011F01127|nr:hypothetical protein [Bosea sp. F3-2]QEL23177.1 hypothetical protein FQV39_11780 [Bosea sp. F3-2]
MAVIIPFALYRYPQARSCPFPRRMAEILFFTGVRYEQAAETSPLQAKARPARRPRKAVRKMDHRQPA